VQLKEWWLVCLVRLKFSKMHVAQRSPDSQKPEHDTFDQDCWAGFLFQVFTFFFFNWLAKKGKQSYKMLQT
jgi:hypothetical protein